MNNDPMNPADPKLPEESDEYEPMHALNARDERRCSLLVGVANFLLVAGGIAAAGVVLVPGRTAGASRTARLEWRHRDAEITRVVEVSDPAASKSLQP